MTTTSDLPIPAPSADLPPVERRPVIPAGFKAGGLAAGIKASGRPDLAVVVSTAGPAAAAAVFTPNTFAAAPVRLSKAHLAATSGDARGGFSWAEAIISTSFGCPYEGEIAPERVGYLAGLMKGIGVQHIGVADTIGVGTPRKVQRAMEAALQHYDIDDVSGHFHDTYGQALANTLATLELGVWQFDTSIAGLGGCPYAKGATGNAATEDVVYMLHGMDIETGIDLDKLLDAGKFISDFLERKPNSRAATALLNKRAG